MVGLTGSFVDPRTMAVMQTASEAATEEPRVIWNASTKRLQVTHSGSAGARKFVLDGGTAVAAAEEVRRDEPEACGGGQLGVGTMKTCHSPGALPTPMCRWH